MFELIWDIAYTAAAIYGGVWGTRKYYKVGPEAPGAKALKGSNKAMKVLGR